MSPETICHQSKPHLILCLVIILVLTSCQKNEGDFLEEILASDISQNKIEYFPFGFITDSNVMGKINTCNVDFNTENNCCFGQFELSQNSKDNFKQSLNCEISKVKKIVIKEYYKYARLEGLCFEINNNFNLVMYKSDLFIIPPEGVSFKMNEFLMLHLIDSDQSFTNLDFNLQKKMKYYETFVYLGENDISAFKSIRIGVYRKTLDGNVKKWSQNINLEWIKSNSLLNCSKEKP